MSRPIVDAKGRRRCKTIAFRMSPAEADQLDLRVALSGLSKQEFIARSLLEGTFTVVATTRMRKAVKERMGPVVAELRRCLLYTSLGALGADLSRRQHGILGQAVESDGVVEDG